MRLPEVGRTDVETTHGEIVQDTLSLTRSAYVCADFKVTPLHEIISVVVHPWLKDDKDLIKFPRPHIYNRARRNNQRSWPLVIGRG